MADSPLIFMLHRHPDYPSTFILRDVAGFIFAVGRDVVYVTATRLREEGHHDLTKFTIRDANGRMPDVHAVVGASLVPVAVSVLPVQPAASAAVPVAVARNKVPAKKARVPQKAVKEHKRADAAKNKKKR